MSLVSESDWSADESAESDSFFSFSFAYMRMCSIDRLFRRWISFSYSGSSMSKTQLISLALRLHLFVSLSVRL